MSRQSWRSSQRRMSRHSSLCHDTDQENDSGILSRHFITLLRRIKMKISDELCHDKRNLYHDRKWKNNETGQDNVPATEFSMLQ